MKNITKCEAFGGDDLTDSITDLDYNVVEIEDNNGGGWIPSLG